MRDSLLSPDHPVGGALETFGRPGARSRGDLKESREVGSIKRSSGSRSRSQKEIYTVDNYKSDVGVRSPSE